MRREKVLWIFLSFMTLILPPVLLWADCTELGKFTGWALQDSHTIIFYRDNRPLASVTLQDCEVKHNSAVRLASSYVCESDTIFIDNTECSILKVQIMN